MKNILIIPGSTREGGSTMTLANSLASHSFVEHQVTYTTIHERLPLFLAQNEGTLPPIVQEWRKLIAKADAVIICTPEYIYNIPALIKNALEWVTSSGEMMHKSTLAMTYTPNAPRGRKAMTSLINSLTALDCRIAGQLALYQTDFNFEEQLSGEGLDLFRESIAQL